MRIVAHSSHLRRLLNYENVVCSILAGFAPRERLERKITGKLSLFTG